MGRELFKHTAVLPRDDIASMLTDLGERLQDGRIELSSGQETHTLAVPEQAELEITVEADGRERSLEIEVEWAADGQGEGLEIA